MLIKLCGKKVENCSFVWPCTDFCVNLVFLSGRYLAYSETTLNISLRENLIEHTTTFSLPFIVFVVVVCFYENLASGGNNSSVCHLGIGGTCRWDFLLSMVYSQEKMEKKFERRSESTDLFLPLLVAAKKPAQFSIFLFCSSWWHGKML